MAKSGIYCIANLINGKQYIGKAVDICSRWNVHKSELRRNIHPNKHLQKAWNKYGEENFKFSIVELNDKSKLSELEIKWIAELDTFKNGYNLTEGGEGQLGRKLSDEQKSHLSQINKGKNNPSYGLKRSAETKKKMSESMRGIKHKPHTEEWKFQISKKLKGIPKIQNRKRVICIENGTVYESITDASNHTDCSIQSISKVCLKKRGSTKGLHFKFFEEAI